MTQPQSDPSHDFDFLFGRWHVDNQYLAARLQQSETWTTFAATNDCHPILGGVGNVDEFVPQTGSGMIGMSLRLFNPKTQQWSIYWIDNRSVTLDVPVVGSFANGVGIFQGADTFDGKPIIARFTWSDITPTSARWQQDYSPDDGQTWETNWIMTFTRLSDTP